MSTPCAGILFASPNEGGSILFVRRSADAGDFPGAWCFPGGTGEGDETPEQTAAREATEEIGAWPEGPMQAIATSDDGSVRFTTFICKVPEPFTPTLNDEHDGYVWASAKEPPQPLHPGVANVLSLLTGDEMNAAALVASGAIISGTKFKNIHLFAMRIFGTGAAYRVGLDEYTWRDPAIFLAPEMVQRCNGLPVIIDHPENALLNSEEFSNRVVGSVMLPYIKGDEVWGVARIYDDAVASVMRETQLSTSPTVSFSNSHDNTTINLDDGSKLLIEGNPSLLCHVAICERGVWDKGGAPAGIDTGSVSVTDEEKAKADAERDEKEKADKAKADAEAGKVDETEDLHSKMDKILDLIGGLSTRMDSVEKRKDSEDGETEEKRKEREAKEKADAECKERDDKAKADAESLKARMDAFDEKTKPRSDEDMDAMADAQCKADSAYSSHGQRAPRPMAGETPLAFRLRALRGLQQHSPSLKGANLALIAGDAVAFADIEGRIYADSEAASRRPAAIPEGVLMKRERQEGPHTITEFLGRSPSVWMNEFRRVNTRGSIKQIKAA